MDPMFSTLISILFIVPLYYIIKVYNNKQKIAKYIDKLPGPKTVPLLGNVLQLRVPRNSKCLIQRVFYTILLSYEIRDIAAKYGEMYSYASEATYL